MLSTGWVSPAQVRVDDDSMASLSGVQVGAGPPLRSLTAARLRGAASRAVFAFAFASAFAWLCAGSFLAFGGLSFPL